MSNATPAEMFRVVYLGSFALRAFHGGSMPIVEATKELRRLKRCGRTVWIETEAGKFFPVTGSTRKPRQSM